MRPDALAENLELVFVDMNGVPRGKTIKSSTLREDNLPHIAAAVLCQCITGAYSHNAMDVYDPKDEDMLLSPQWSTCRPTPWHSDDTSQVIVETIDKTGGTVAFDPRNVLRRVLQRYQALGLKPIVAPELEFYLLSPLGRSDTELAAGPLYGKTWAAKIAGASLSLFGVIYHVALVALFLGAIAAADIETYFLGASLLLIHVVAMAFVFRKSDASAS